MKIETIRLRQGFGGRSLNQMIISLIAAMGTNRVIGRGAKMPWHLPDELDYFMEKTKGHYILMGRKTFLAYKQILKGHKVIVVTQQQDFDGEYAKVTGSPEEGINFAAERGESELFISGGGQIYKTTIDRADKIYLTIIDGQFEGDVHFPEFDLSEWELISKDHHPVDERHAYSFEFLVYRRKD